MKNPEKMLELLVQLNKLTAAVWEASDVQGHSEGHPGALGFTLADSTHDRIRIHLESVEQTLKTTRQRLFK